ncbi:GspH/FimT family pseudopilin [Polymorphobacter fuscus]|nr:GspH/FimT family pseudopilin [Polymorphobacter fuscus]NJC07118.1 general secretion pathway protein H [Polymorphobacter fuscus]
MPTSATGADRAGTPSPRRDGFTLVELMVVLVIIGLAAATVVVAIPDQQARLADDADAFAARLVAARDLSIVSGRDIAVEVDAVGYRFAQRRVDGWQPAAAKALQARLWGTGTAVQTRIDNGDRLVFDTTGLATPALVTLQRGRGRASIAVDAAGAVHVDAR